MGILRASYLKQNIGSNVDIFLQNKRKLTSVVVICRPCSRKWRNIANIGDFEGLAFGVYLSVIRERLSSLVFPQVTQALWEIYRPCDLCSALCKSCNMSVTAAVA